MKNLPRIAALGTAIVFGLFLLGFGLVSGHVSGWWALPGIAAVFGLCLLLTGRMEKRAAELRLPQCTAGQDLLILLGIALIPRLAAVLLLPQDYISDYALYMDLARDYAATGAVQPTEFMLKSASNITVYVAVLGSWMRLFGTSIASAEVWSVMMGTVNVLMVYSLGREWLTRNRAFAAAALFALLPETVFYSLLPGIETISLFSLLAGLILAAHSQRSEGPGVSVLTAFTGGAALAFSAANRASAWAMIAAFALWTVFRGRRRIPTLAAFALGLAAVMGWHAWFQGIVFGSEKPASTVGWSLYEGLDLAAAGGWSSEKYARLQELMSQYSAAEVQRILFEEAWQRFALYSPAEKCALFLVKGGTVWFLSSYCMVSGNTTVQLIVSGITDAGWMLAMAFWMRGLFRVWKRGLSLRAAPCWSICMMSVLFTALWCEFGTSIARYHYVLIPMILLSAAAVAGQGGQQGGENPAILSGVEKGG